MSFTRITRIAPSTAAAATCSYRCFSTTVRTLKGPIQATKDAAKMADRRAANAAIKGIETGEKATQKVKETVGYKTKADEKKAKAKGITAESKDKAGQGPV